ncbi:hypothetical protein [Hyphomicrobium sp. CS1GBMeth3]|uniref:DUF6950 family protein n=1 Tax=Hyphomicrobium sp. CS1GBMeth3 TaxID=1892845 RepID=UPI000B18E2C6|nr:hypothetical protein [Hyphomicrobium sp. CS1GBMeth3]
MSNIQSDLNRRQRAERWPALLREVVRRHAESPFAWGECDCATLFGQSVEAIAGFDPIPERLNYRTPQGALQSVRKAGFGSMLELVAARFPEIPPSAAQRGDLGFLAEDNGPLVCPMIIDGSIAHVKALSGYCQIPRGLVARAFAV